MTYHIASPSKFANHGFESGTNWLADEQSTRTLPKRGADESVASRQPDRAALGRPSGRGNEDARYIPASAGLRHGEFCTGDACTGV